jgi:hypothetical protein
MASKKRAEALTALRLRIWYSSQAYEIWGSRGLGLWDAIPCSVLEIYRCFGGSCRSPLCLEDGGSTFLWNIGKLLLHPKVSHPRWYCRVFGWLGTPFRSLIGFINNLQVVTTINHNTVTHLQPLHATLFTLSAAVFTYSVSLNHTLQIKPSVHTSHIHRQTSCILLYSWFQFV